jgi:hypothetical protein
MERQEFEALRARVESLERRMRIAVAGWVLSVVALVVLGVAAQQAVSQPGVLRARSFEVVDAAGRRRIGLGVLPDGSPKLGLHDAAGRTRAGLAVLPGGSPVLALDDAAGRTRIMLTLTPDGSPWLTLNDAAGRVVFRAP